MAMLAMPKFEDGTRMPRWRVMLELKNGYMMAQMCDSRKVVKIVLRNLQSLYGERIKSLRVTDSRPRYIRAGWKPPESRRRR